MDRVQRQQVDPVPLTCVLLHQVARRAKHLPVPPEWQCQQCHNGCPLCSRARNLCRQPLQEAELRSPRVQLAVDRERRDRPLLKVPDLVDDRDSMRRQVCLQFPRTADSARSFGRWSTHARGLRVDPDADAVSPQVSDGLGALRASLFEFQLQCPDPTCIPPHKRLSSLPIGPGRAASPTSVSGPLPPEASTVVSSPRHRVVLPPILISRS